MANIPDDRLQYLAAEISNSDHLVVFTGAGISTASGLPDYRGPEGLWTLRDKGITPEPSQKPWFEHDPNPGHQAIYQLQELKKLKFLISQNVDGLHLKSGIDPKLIAELHGNATLFECLGCGSRHNYKEIGWNREKHGRGYRTDPPRVEQPVCPQCGGRLVSSIVNFGDALPPNEVEKSHDHAEKADVFLVLGSSLSVYPAASFPRIAKKKGAKLFIINQGGTGLDSIADLKIEGDVSILLPKIVELVTECVSH